MLTKNQLIKVIGNNVSGSEYHLQANLLTSNIILIDINKTDIDRLTALKIITEKFPDKNIIVLSHDTENDFNLQVTEIETQFKPTCEYQQENQISATKYRENEISQKVKCNSINGCACLTNVHSKTTTPGIKKEILTYRELEILKEIINGLTNKEIAKLFNISENTVRNHLRNMMEKLQVDNRVQIVTYAVKEGWVN